MASSNVSGFGNALGSTNALGGTPNIGTYQLQAQAIARQRALADAIAQESVTQGQPQGQMVGDRYVPASWTQQLAQALKGPESKYLQGQADTSEKAMIQNQAQARMDYLNSMPQSTPASGGEQPSLDNVGPVRPVTPAQQPTQQQRLAWALKGISSGDPVQAQFAQPSLDAYNVQQTLSSLGYGNAGQPQNSAPQPPMGAQPSGTGQGSPAPQGVAPSPSGGISSGGLGNVDPTALAFSLSSNPTIHGTAPMIAAANAPTDAVKNLRQAGIDPNSPQGRAFLSQVATQNGVGHYDAQGNYNIDQGYVAGQGAIKGAETTAEEKAKAPYVFPTPNTTDSQGRQTFTSAASLQPPTGAPAGPNTPTPAAFPSVSPAQQTGANAKQISVLQNELATADTKDKPLIQAQINDLTARGNAGTPFTPQPQAYGQSTIEKQYQKGATDKALSYEDSLNNRVSTGSDLMMRLGEAKDALAQTRSGGGMAARAQIASVAQAIGLPSTMVDQIAGGNLGAAQRFQQLAVQDTLQQLKQATQGGANRILKTEFDVFQKSNPNLDTDPRGIDKVYTFLNKVYLRDRGEQQAFNQYKQSGQPLDQWQNTWQGMQTAPGGPVNPTPYAGGGVKPSSAPVTISGGIKFLGFQQ